LTFTHFHGKTFGRHGVGQEGVFMKMLALFQSGLLMAVYITLNLPKDFVSAYLFPDDLTVFQQQVYESMTTVAVFSAVYFMLLFYTNEPEHEKPAGVFLSAVFGPIGVHLAANEQLWRRMDDGLRLMALTVAFIMLPVLLIKKGWGNAVCFLFSSSVFVSAYAFGLYCANGKYSWVMFYASIVIILPEVIIDLIGSRVRAI
jgi:hypothetical protein